MIDYFRKKAGARLLWRFWHEPIHFFGFDASDEWCPSHATHHEHSSLCPAFDGSGDCDLDCAEFGPFQTVEFQKCPERR